MPRIRPRIGRLAAWGSSGLIQTVGAAPSYPTVDADLVGAAYTVILAVGAAVAVVAYILLLGVMALPEKRK